MGELWEAVDWSALEHAYGPATDVPPLLEAIAAGKAAAVDALANLLAHQGWSSPAAARPTSRTSCCRRPPACGPGVGCPRVS